jgi:hypothetical protein
MSATGRWFGGDMGERFIAGALQPREPVHNNTDMRIAPGPNIRCLRWTGRQCCGAVMRVIVRPTPKSLAAIARRGVVP